MPPTEGSKCFGASSVPSSLSGTEALCRFFRGETKELAKFKGVGNLVTGAIVDRTLTPSVFVIYYSGGNQHNG